MVGLHQRLTEVVQQAGEYLLLGSSELSCVLGTLQEMSDVRKRRAEPEEVEQGGALRHRCERGHRVVAVAEYPTGASPVRRRFIRALLAVGVHAIEIVRRIQLGDQIAVDRLCLLLGGHRLGRLFSAERREERLPVNMHASPFEQPEVLADSN